MPSANGLILSPPSEITPADQDDGHQGGGHCHLHSQDQKRLAEASQRCEAIIVMRHGTIVDRGATAEFLPVGNTSTRAPCSTRCQASRGSGHLQSELACQ